MDTAIAKRAVLNALGTAAYVVLVATFMYNTPKVFGDVKSVFIPIAMLMLLVFSAALTGSLVFGLPVLWYLDGRRREALSLLMYTLGALCVITILAFLVLFIAS